MDALSSPPFNTAMQALQKLKHPARWPPVWLSATPRPPCPPSSAASGATNRPAHPENRWIPDSLFLGATVGALVSGILLHLAGHRRTLLLSSGGLTSFWVSLMLANRVSMIAKRTLYGGLVEVSTSVGMLCAYVMAGFAWQQQAVGCAMASVPILALQRYVIENPRWLMSKHLSLDADTSVMRLYGLDLPPDFRESKKKGAEEHKPASTFQPPVAQ
ncbi:hypothetical protein MRX96_057489 [Rhipicephalus microplus]